MIRPHSVCISTYQISNTSYSVYIASQVLKKLVATYPNGVEGQEQVSAEKTKIIYDALDAHPDAYKVVPSKGYRSRMNMCFRVIKGGDTEAAEKDFLAKTIENGLIGLKGHRSVGGMRASNYNTLTVEGAQKLATFIHEYAKA